MTLYLALGILLLATVSLAQGTLWLTENKPFLPNSINRFLILGFALPTLLISSFLVYNKNFELGLGVITGSVILSVLIIGISSIYKPLEINKKLALKQIALGLMSSIILAFLIFKDFFNYLSSWTGLEKKEQDKFMVEWQSGKLDKLQFGDLYISQGIILCLLFLIVAFSLFHFKTNSAESKEAKSETKFSWKGFDKRLIKPIGGLIFVTIGSKLVSDVALNSTRLISSLGISNLSDRLLGLTIIALVSIIPLAIYSFQKIKANQSENLTIELMQVGIFNLLASFGVVSLIAQISVLKTQMLDFGDLVGTFLILFLVVICSRKSQINRVQGVVLTASYFVYLGYLVYNK